MPRTRSLVLTLTGLILGFVLCPPVRAQDRPRPALSLSGMTPGAGRLTVTESWARFDFSVRNAGDTDRLVRVLAFYPSHPDVHYGRDVWVPARSTHWTWLLMGPVPPGAARGFGTEIQMLLHDRTDGTERLVLPEGQERIRNRAVPYRKRQPETALLLDEEQIIDPVTSPGEVPQPLSLGQEAVQLARAFRVATELRMFVQIPGRGPLPTVPEAFDGLDHFLIASGRIAQDAAGTRALRHWVERGGKAWVMLDRVEPDAVAGLLGDALDFQVVDRTDLTRFTVESRTSDRGGTEKIPQEHERPVRFVRVHLPDHERPIVTLDGWPVWFTRRLGRGTVVFTTLGARAWYLPGSPDAPKPTGMLTVFTGRFLHPEQDPLGGTDGKPSPFVDALQRSLNEEIGYRVIDRGTVFLILAGFLLAVLAVGVAMRWSRRPERVGWLAPAVALAACAVLVYLGDRARRAVPPTVAVAQLVAAVPDTGDAAVRGLMSVYRPGSGLAPVGASRGGLFELDVKGLEGKTRRLIRDDLDAWHWEGVELPAGARPGTFRHTIPAAISASYRLTAEGIEGKLSAGPFEEYGDALLQVAGDRPLAVRLRPDGTFSAGSQDALPEGQFLAGALLSDRQRRRHEVYRELLKPPATGRVHQRDLLLVWTRPVDLGFSLAPESRTAGDALLTVPVRLERPAAGTRVTIPGPVVGYHRVLGGGPARLTRTQRAGAELHLRFLLPPAVLPFEVERVRLSGRIEAPSRRMTLHGRDGGKPVEVHRVEDPMGPFRIELADPRLLKPDEGGGLHLYLTISEVNEGKKPAQGGKDDPRWTLEYLELEVVGTTKG